MGKTHRMTISKSFDLNEQNIVFIGQFGSFPFHVTCNTHLYNLKFKIINNLVFQVSVRSFKAETQSAAVLLPKAESQVDDLEGPGLVDEAGQEMCSEML